MVGWSILETFVCWKREHKVNNICSVYLLTSFFHQAKRHMKLCFRSETFRWNLNLEKWVTIVHHLKVHTTLKLNKCCTKLQNHCFAFFRKIMFNTKNINSCQCFLPIHFNETQKGIGKALKIKCNQFPTRLRTYFLFTQ